MKRKKCSKISFRFIFLIETTIEDDTWKVQRYWEVDFSVGPRVAWLTANSSGHLCFQSFRDTSRSTCWKRQTWFLSGTAATELCAVNIFESSPKKKTFGLKVSSNFFVGFLFFFIIIIIHYLLFPHPFLFSFQSFCGQLMTGVCFFSQKFSTSYWNLVLRSPPALQCIFVFRFHYSWPLVSIPLWPAVVLKVNNFALRDFVIDATYFGVVRIISIDFSVVFS